ncbi:GrpE protein [Loigolactobacillus rennini DSM 20253]|uniref:Protein GrpE n=1 Tax=Loigolactobacillus rennini DSM 20253 TaxID=1423796 RepID=A0A0R2DII3_9LACO|nr:nucleotide exchange factor GrpE [Loigolactobacillus rennini]KRN00108.1 GrpE protein [Loigolactobacillus rennini DSM 20253]
MAKKKQTAADESLAQNPEYPSEKDLDAGKSTAKSAAAKSTDSAKQTTASATTDSNDQAAASTQAKAKPATDEQAEQIKKLKAQAEATEDKYLRAEAEIQNMNARFKKEREQLLKYEGQDLAKSILPVMDNLERALAVEASDQNGKQLKKGVEMVYDHLERALKDHQIIEITAMNQTFDPTIHQAVQTVAVEGDQKPETVVKVLQKGYKLKDRVLRPAMVVVAQ